MRFVVLLQKTILGEDRSFAEGKERSERDRMRVVMMPISPEGRVHTHTHTHHRAAAAAAAAVCDDPCNRDEDESTQELNAKNTSKSTTHLGHLLGSQKVCLHLGPNDL